MGFSMTKQSQTYAVNYHVRNGKLSRMTGSPSNEVLKMFPETMEAFSREVHEDSNPTRRDYTARLELTIEEKK
jgi:hypothetical protein